MTPEVLYAQVGASTLSPDGYFFWDGAQWNAVVSPDGLWRWDGAAWVPASQSHTASARGYASARTLGAWVSVLLGLCIAVAFVQVLVFDPYVQGWLAFGDQTAYYTVDVAGLFSLLVTTPLFLVWFHRAYRNAAALGAGGLRFSSGWAVGWWFVPIACLWMPCLAAVDIWKASGGVTPAADGDLRRQDAAPTLVVLWWVAWLAFLVMANVTGVLDNPNDNSFLLSVLSNGATVLAAVLAIIVVMSVSAREETCSRQLSSTTASQAVASIEVAQ